MSKNKNTETQNTETQNTETQNTETQNTETQNTVKPSIGETLKKEDIKGEWIIKNLNMGTLALADGDDIVFLYGGDKIRTTNPELVSKARKFGKVEIDAISGPIPEPAPRSSSFKDKKYSLMHSKEYKIPEVNKAFERDTKPLD